ncbi:MAG: hypothetical protein ABUS79_18115, partial [Pseudomonadota bacterium]
MTPGAALLVALFSQAAGGAAVDATVPAVRLDVHAPADCTSRADLAARIAARSPRVHVADDAPVVGRVTITSARGGGLTAEVVVASAGVDQPPRRVAARSCAEAADAAALIIAVTLDPTLIRSSSSAPAPTRKPVVETTAAVEPPVSAAPAATHRREFSGAVAAQTIAGAAPGVLPGLALYGMV